MKNKLIALLFMAIFIIFTFVGCRDLNSGSDATSSGMNLNSTVSGVVSKVQSDGKALQSQVSGVVSNVESGGKAIGSQVSGTISAITSSK